MHCSLIFQQTSKRCVTMYMRIPEQRRCWSIFQQRRDYDWDLRRRCVDRESCAHWLHWRASWERTCWIWWWNVARSAFVRQRPHCDRCRYQMPRHLHCTLYIVHNTLHWCTDSTPTAQASKAVSDSVVVVVVCIRSHNWSARQRHHRLQSVV